MQKLLANFITSQFELEMSQDCEIHVNYTQRTWVWNGPSTTAAISQDKHTLVLKKMVALPTECSWLVLAFMRRDSTLALQR